VELLNRIGNASLPVTPENSGKDHVRTPRPSAGQTFQNVLDSQLKQPGDLKFSLHAVERMQSRNIQLSDQQVQKLRTGVDKVAEKGGRESLMFMDSSAFLVSVRNGTVITAIARDNLKENVFTNIDSAVVL